MQRCETLCAAEMWLQRHFPSFNASITIWLETCASNGCFQNTGTPKWMVYNGKPYEQMDDLGIALFLETPKSWHVGIFLPGLHARIWIQRFSNIRKWFKACWRLALGALVELIQFHPLTRFCPAWKIVWKSRFWPDCETVWGFALVNSGKLPAV